MSSAAIDRQPKFTAFALVLVGLVAFFCGSARPTRPNQRRKTRTWHSSRRMRCSALRSSLQAKPGDIVTFKATVKLSGGAHIYKYSTKQAAGPINTTFDFFDTAGLEVEGDWTPSQEPEKHKDPNFAELEFVEYHEHEVTWTIKLKIPEGTAPGKKVLRCQAKYQVCDAKSCSIPGQWTLPDADLTVVAGDGKVPETTAAAKPAEPKSPVPATSKPAEPQNSATPIRNLAEPWCRRDSTGFEQAIQSEIAQKAQQG